MLSVVTSVALIRHSAIGTPRPLLFIKERSKGWGVLFGHSSVQTNFETNVFQFVCSPMHIMSENKQLMPIKW